MTLSQAAKEYIKLSKIYGDVFFVETGAREKVLVVNSAAAAKELFDKRSDIYSSRPYNPLIIDLGSEGYATTHMTYGKRYRSYRKVMALSIKPNMLSLQREAIRKVVLQQMAEAADRPESWCERSALFAARLGSVITFGREIKDLDDYMISEMLAINEEFFDSMDDFAAAPILKRFPWLIKIPIEFKWKQQALKHSRREQGFYNSIMTEAKERYDMGTLPPCGAYNLFEQQGQDAAAGMSSREKEHALGSLYAASFDPPKKMMDTIVFALMTHPSVCKKAAEEVESICGSSRLPEFGDLEQLPYCRAIFMECLRWRANVPFGLPHATQKEDIYRNWRIPKGCTVMGNTLAMHMDPSIWDEPERFDPERHYGRDKAIASEKLMNGFGYAKRACPGEGFARMTHQLTIAMLVTLFEILPTGHLAGEKDLEKVSREWEYEEGTAVGPTPFPSTLRLLPGKQALLQGL